jgi:hypothetical protein
VRRWRSECRLDPDVLLLQPLVEYDAVLSLCPEESHKSDPVAFLQSL